MRREEDRRRRDDGLLRRFLKDPQGSSGRRAAAELFRLYRGHVYQWCYRYVREHEQALDLSQEVMLEAYRGLNGFRGESGFSSWLFAVTRNRCVSALRKRARTEIVDIDPDLLEDPRLIPEAQLEQREEKERVLRLITENLTSREQEAVCLRIFERMPVEAITQVLGIEGVSGARSILQSARRKLRAAAARQEAFRGESGHA